MTNCCSMKQPAHPKEHACPVNGKPYKEVPISTVQHHVRHVWNKSLSESTYYFCEDPECDVVYFGINDSTITGDAVRTRVSSKDNSDDAPLCYCFGVNRKEAAEIPEARAFVIEQTKNHACSCSTSNPSGRCCLKDFPVA